MVDISIIILNYKSSALAESCLASIKAADWAYLSKEIILIDNASDDGVGLMAAEKYPEVKFIQNDQNLGMGAGNNIGLRQAQGEYVVIMNPDTRVEGDTFVCLHDFMTLHADVGVVGPKQLNVDGSVQQSIYRWHSLFTPALRRTPLGKMSSAQRHIDKFLMRDSCSDCSRDVDWLLGSFLFCRRSALENVGYFDERYFMYFEDTDLCRRFWQSGWRVTYCPRARIVHDHQRQSARLPWYLAWRSRATRYHVASWLRYLWKWGITQPQYDKLEKYE